MIDENCSVCGGPHKRKQKTHKPPTCGKCRAKRAAFHVKGKPASNRLPGDLGAFNALYSTYKARANKTGRSFELTVTQFRELTKQNCSYCGLEPSSFYRNRGKADPYLYNGIDRKDSSIGYTIENSVPCCSICNYMKQELSQEVWLAHMQRILEYQSVQPKSGNRVFLP